LTSDDRSAWHNGRYGCAAFHLWQHYLGGPTLGLKRAAGSFYRSARLTARDAHEKRTRFEAAPAASLAGHVGPLI